VCPVSETNAPHRLGAAPLLGSGTSNNSAFRETVHAEQAGQDSHDDDVDDLGTHPAGAPNQQNRQRTPRSETDTELKIDKSVLAFPEPRRIRDTEHLKFVGRQPCLICGRAPSDAHHLRFAQLRALGRKVSDEFTVPLCRTHHRELHRRGDEKSWWEHTGIEPLGYAHDLWQQTRKGED
jgi:hypothetical protein